MKKFIFLLGSTLLACTVAIAQTPVYQHSKMKPTTPKVFSFYANGVHFEMVRVEGGTFTMGATAEQGDDVYADEMPAHEVTLSSYCIGKTEVTQALWRTIGANAGRHA